MGRKSRFDGMSALDLAIIHNPALAGQTGYIKFFRDGWRGDLHRWLWEQLVGPIPPGYEIDHINGTRHDCRLSNLRCVPRVVNMRNSAKQSNNTTGITGVSRTSSEGIIYWSASWVDPITNKKCLKRFSTRRMTEAEARQKAIDYREMQVEYLTAFHDYSDRHGS